jgi:hypothetical protein
MPDLPWRKCRLLLAALAALSVPTAWGACQAPYEALPGGPTTTIPAGEQRQFPADWTISAEEQVLLEGGANITGGVTIRGTLFLSSSDPSTLAADWVVIESGGALVAGSEACPLTANVTATIMLRAGDVHPVAGRKALALMAGGTLEVGHLAAAGGCC